MDEFNEPFGDLQILAYRKTLDIFPRGYCIYNIVSDSSIGIYSSGFVNGDGLSIGGVFGECNLDIDKSYIQILTYIILT